MAQGLITQTEFLDHGTDALSILYPLDRQRLELGRISLFKPLHFVLSKSDSMLAILGRLILGENYIFYIYLTHSEKNYDQNG